MSNSSTYGVAPRMYVEQAGPLWPRAGGRSPATWVLSFSRTLHAACLPTLGMEDCPRMWDPRVQAIEHQYLEVPVHEGREERTIEPPPRVDLEPTCGCSTPTPAR